MNRWDRLKLSLAIGVLSFFIQVVFLVINVQFVDPSTGHFRLGAQLRFKFVDETTRQFVLVSQLRRLPGELLHVAEIASAASILCYAALGWYYRQPPKCASEVSESTVTDD
jgi:hypothetical protein